METLEKRFQYCDPRFHPYLEKVLERLPEEIKKEILDNENFQVLADDAFHDTCVLRHRFDPPVQSLVYLNTKALREPEHQIILTIASQIAFYIAGKERMEVDSQAAENLLVRWGFGNEIQAVRYEQAIAGSEGYQIGYKWAKNQNKDYLLQHFGLYFDEWNQKGWSQKSSELLKAIAQQPQTPSILEELAQFKEVESTKPEAEPKPEMYSKRQAILAGIMTAVKEIELLEQYSPQICELGQI